MLERTNADLANNVGNLYSRVLALIEKNEGGVVPPPDGAPTDATLDGLADAARASYRAGFEAHDPSAALRALILPLALLVASPAVAQGRTDFDHLATGYALSGAHLGAPCESCHVRGVFKGTPRACEGCHSTGTRVSASAMPPSHPPTTQADRKSVV